MIVIIIFWVLLQHGTYFYLCKSCHLVKTRIEWIIGSYIKTACKIIHRHRTHSCQEYSLDAWICTWLNCVVEGAKISCTMCLRSIVVLTRNLWKYCISEMIILIDEEIETLTCFVTKVAHTIKLFYCSFFLLQFYQGIFRQKPWILLTKRSKDRIAIRIHRLSIGTNFSIDNREIKIQY